MFVGGRRNTTSISSLRVCSHRRDIGAGVDWFAGVAAMVTDTYLFGTSQVRQLTGATCRVDRSGRAFDRLQKRAGAATRND